MAQLNRKQIATEIKKKKLYIYSTLSLEKTKDLYKALMQISKKKRRKKYTTIRKKIKIIIGHLLRLG